MNFARTPGRRKSRSWRVTTESVAIAKTLADGIHMNTTTPLNIISPKALDKQLKIVESRIQVLQSEISDLEKVKNACLILLGSTPEAPEGVEAASSAAPVKNKKKRSENTDEETAENSQAPALAAEPPVEESPTAY